TAGIAINAAMTGHVVLSTLHTNDATTTLPRLLDMGVEPFLISSTVNIAIGQRLVRKIHQACVESYTPSTVEKSQLEETIGQYKMEKSGLDKEKLRLYRGKGCELCHGTGYEGRIGIFEVLEITEEVRKLIMQRSNSEEIRKKAIAQEMTTMFDDGIQKVIQGTTTLEEVLRVTRE
ncbi:MAG: General secretion pathway protein E, partial [Parcubacteria group bacterium GW2011_GWA2_48_9]